MDRNESPLMSREAIKAKLDEGAERILAGKAPDDDVDFAIAVSGMVLRIFPKIDDFVDYDALAKLIEAAGKIRGR